jgi:hypothetical protein
VGVVANPVTCRDARGSARHRLTTTLLLNPTRAVLELRLIQEHLTAKPVVLSGSYEASARYSGTTDIEEEAWGTRRHFSSY